MDWSFVPFVPFFATFFGVLAAFGLQWIAKRNERLRDKKQFLQDIKMKLETGSSLLTFLSRIFGMGSDVSFT